MLYAFCGDPLEETDLAEIEEFSTAASEAAELPAADPAALALSASAPVAEAELFTDAPAESLLSSGEPREADAVAPAEVEVTVSATMPPKNGAAYRPGEVITFIVTAVNHTSDNLLNLTVSETLSGKSWSQSDFLHGAKAPFLFPYTVTEADAHLGSFCAEASVSAVSRDGVEYNVGPAAAVFPAGF